ncbi:carbon-nitrogen hydrolase family protein [Pseudonocardia sp. C8]|uniref:carbon-nitrogen hydrolase family protein n=1 Tax=Pseudonocardia sp. C8 TaxID=2762759 RepID=UPI0016428247|nr:nitrilase-related carbon-nitrogen hydrolase [Pseudonocardia sp. C8]MBC3190419.1 carbon-nitrogen hydrolase family protein [Pseudonocardia sp. C8]
MKQTVVVSLVQFTASETDKELNVTRCLEYLDEAAEQGADLVVLPEMWTGFGYSTPTRYQEIAEPVPGPVTDRLAERAARHGMYVVGSLYAGLPDGSHANLAPLIGPDGALLGSYTKTHLFDAPDRVDIPPGMKESDKVVAGDELAVFDTRFGSLGISVCSDLRFPEVYRVMTLRGAKIIVCASAFLSPRLDHWEFFLRARAAENQVFVVASGQVGTEPVTGTGFVGRSMAVDPWGTVLATAPDVEGVTTTRLDLDLIPEMRRRYPLLDQRRPDLYGDIVRR